MRAKIEDYFANIKSIYFTRQFLLFLVLNGTSALTNMCARYVFSLVMSYAMAIVAAYIIGIAVAFTLNNRFTFKRSENSLPMRTFGFIVVNMIGLVQTLTVSLLLRNYLLPWIGFAFHSNEVAHFLGLSTTAFTSFIGHKYFSFKD